MNERSTTKLSSEFLNAYVDGQLDPEEKSRAFVEIGRDEAIGREVCELHKLHELVRFAYTDLPTPPSRTLPSSGRHRAGLGLAAGVALVVGVVIGWVLHQPPPPAGVASRLVTGNPSPAVPAPARLAARTVERATSPAVAPAPAQAPVSPAQSSPVDASTVAGTAVEGVPVAAAQTGSVSAAEGAPVKILFHVNRGSALEQTRALDDIEMLVRHYREQRQNARIEVILNGEGLNLVRSDIGIHTERLRRLQGEYSNLTFAACQNTIDRLKREQGVIARLLPGVVVIDSGVAQIMRRQQQGWAYIQV